MKTKVLYVYGDYDYGALNFEENIDYDNIEQFLKEKKLTNNGDTYEEENGEFYVKLKIFDGEISEEFENFIKNEICDYDGLKNTSFYVIRDKKSQ